MAGAGLADPIAVELILTEGPAAVQRLIEHGALFDAGPDGLLRTREGGHSANRVIHAGGDATGAEIERALAGGPRAAVGARRAPGTRRGAGRLRPGPRAVGARTGRSGRPDPQRRGRARHRRRRSPVRRHHQSRGCHRRRTGDGAAGRCRVGRHRVHAVPPDGAVDRPRRPRPPPAGHRSGARRGCGAARRRRRPDHAGRAPAGRPRAARRGVAGRFPADGAGAGRYFRSCVPGRDGHRARRFRPPFSHRVGGLRAGRRQPDDRPDSGRAGRALSLRWGADRPGRAHHGARPVRDRRGLPDGAARSESAGVELPARGPGDG